MVLSLVIVVIAVSLVWNGIEVGACSGKEFTCNNGKCIKKSRYCDGVVDCFDRSDEFCDCEARGHLRCARLGFCVAKSKICDSKNDCIFYEDETDCDNCRGFTCNNGWCLPPGRQCDQFGECPGEEDEKSCSCVDGEHRCKEGNRCILSRWLCDGVADCPSRTDESNCRSKCTAPQIPCNIDQSTCINPEQQCDGQTDCKDGSDEIDCVIVKPNGVLLIFERETSNYRPLCYDSWLTDPVYGASICRLTGAGSFRSSSYMTSSDVPEAENGFFVLGNSSFSDPLLQVVTETSAKCGTIVTIECAYDQCGAITAAVRLNKMRLSPYMFASTRTRSRIGLSLLASNELRHSDPNSLINAERAIQGEYPWQVNLLYDGIPFCGGTLFDDSWILTAAHCVAEEPNPHRYKVRLGSLLLEGETAQENPFLQEIPVEAIIVHPEWEKKRIINDVALMKLKWPAQQTDMVRSLCWPDEITRVDVQKEFIECRTSGWGYVDKQATLLPWTLQATRMSLISDQICQSVFGTDFKHASMLCAGTVSGLITICSGDSGSSLVCRNIDHIWSLVGVASWSPAQVNGAECAGISVFSRFTTFQEWIQETMANPKLDKKFRFNSGSAPSMSNAAFIIATSVIHLLIQLYRVARH